MKTTTETIEYDAEGRIVKRVTTTSDTYGPYYTPYPNFSSPHWGTQTWGTGTSNATIKAIDV